MGKKILVIAFGFGIGWAMGCNAQSDPANGASTQPDHINADTRLTLAPAPNPIWAGEVDGAPWAGEGKREFDFELGVDLGADWLVGPRNHDLALARVSYGGNLTGLVGKNHWYQGNLELLGQFFAGAQYHPRTAYVVGVGPILRYNLVTGTRWMPYIEGGAGALATDIKQPDLSTVYEFNLQGGVGVRYFLSDNTALTVAGRYVHLSNAGIRRPNQGVNTTEIAVGFSWFF